MTIQGTWTPSIKRAYEHTPSRPSRACASAREYRRNTAIVLVSLLACGCGWIAGLEDLSRPPQDAAPHVTESSSSNSSSEFYADGAPESDDASLGIEASTDADADGVTGADADASLGIEASTDADAVDSRLDIPDGISPIVCGPRRAMPVANWRLDEIDCGNVAVDATGHRFNGTKSTRVESRTGRIGMAAWFDGTSSIEFPTVPTLDFTNALTVAAWVNPDAIDALHGIVERWYNLDSYSLTIQQKHFVFSIAAPTDPADGSLGTSYNVHSERLASTGVWTHVAGVFDGAHIKIYVNGQFSAQEDVPVDTRLQETKRLVTLGNRGESDPFKGFIDEVRLYNVALSDDEVAALATAATPTPVAYFRMEECQGVTVRDAFRDDKPGAKQGGVASDNGHIGLASRFDGESGQIEVADGPDLHVSNAVTLAAWVNPQTLGARPIVDSPDVYQLGLKGDKFIFAVATDSATEPQGASFLVEAPAVPNRWTHLAGVFDGTQIVLYIDGCPSPPVALPRGAMLQKSTGPLHIGGYPGGQWFDGRIDEVRIYSTALSAMQIGLLADPAYGW